MLLRKRGIRPYRVIGDDPRNWKPWAVAIGYAIMMTVIVILSFLLMAGVSKKSADESTRVALPALSEEEARLFRARAEEAVRQAPEVYRYNVWKGVNARLAERGLKELDKPEGLVED